jgi:hypothetical protein
VISSVFVLQNELTVLLTHPEISGGERQQLLLDQGTLANVQAGFTALLTLIRLLA